jgi:putative MATE family efflux protein
MAGVFERLGSGQSHFLHNALMNNRYDPITGKVVPVFFHYAVPSIIGMLAASSAGVIDGVFIGNFVGSTALAAVNISMPAWAVFAAIVFMMAVGGSVMCGKFLGEKNNSAASDIFSKTLYATSGIALLVSGLCLIFLDQVVSLLGANEDLHTLVKDYMRIILWFAPLLITALTLDYFVRVDGRPILSSAALVAFAVINIFLNWLFIVKLGWGLKGAAWATAIAEASTLLILITHLFSPRCTLHLVRVSGGWLDVLKAAFNGFSEFANELSIGLTILLFNWVMITRLGVAGVAAYTIIGYLVLIGLEVCYGISETLQPTISKNLGARQPGRIIQFMITGVLSAFAVGLLVSALLLLAPEFMVSMFLADGEGKALAIALEFVAFFWPAFLFNGMNITFASYFTALHKPLQSAAIAVSRSLVLPIAGLLLLPAWFGDRGIYLAIPIAEAITFVLALGLVAYYRPANMMQ